MDDRQEERELVARSVAAISKPVPAPPGWTSPGDGYVFASVSSCRSSECGRAIAWFRTPAGKTAPYDADGISQLCDLSGRGTFPSAEELGYQEGRSVVATKAVDQLALDEKVVEDATLERLLENRQKAKDVASLASAKAKTASEAAAAALEGLDIGNGAAIRIGRFRIEATFRPAATRSFEIGAKEGMKISLVEEK